ncbi:MAG: hormogonium polysaccharide biosynthesis protein HpsA [Coleofasciculus sp. G3-WIS-01]|uniref:hormogonium polysaccharide biosynthesis protein HpsA n=1 Tax=Coleofasciculus sp. G3-WIS-01 TaxID=3069528 RepID=UPI0032F8CD1F
MSTTKKLIKTAQRLIRNILQLGKTLSKQVMNWLLRNLFVFRRHSNSSPAGFVLPTVIMVMLVVTLLTTAIVFRSFDRAKNASNVRVNQAVLNAATPALDRAKAKIDALFADPKLPRGTPSDISLKVVLDESQYNYGDETRVVLPFEFNGQSGIQRVDEQVKQANTIATDETVTTAWRFPVDTDNNGKFDSFTVYGIFFRTPPQVSQGRPPERQPVEARTLPMDEEALLGSECAAAVGTTASLVGSNGWYKVGGDLKRSMFVYTATVPITNLAISANETLSNNTYETYKGNKGFSALEMQEDIARVPLTNNAVIYEDDLEVFAGTNFTLNGRIVTNSNLFVSGTNPKFRQVSSRNSCFYDPENSKIVVGGNVGVGYIAESGNPNAEVPVHLYQGTRRTGDPDVGTQPTKVLRRANKSTTATSAQAAYNGVAYEKRIQHLVTKAEARSAASDPEEVKTEQKKIYDGTDAAEIQKARKVALDRYFRKRTRRVPYAEVPYVPNNLDPENLDSSSITFQVDSGNNDSLRPPDDWIYPFNPSDGKTHTGYAEVALNQNAPQLLPQATDSEIQEESRVEQLVGDRVLVGNNLPALWWDGTKFVGSDKEQPIDDTQWDLPAGNTEPRTRKTRIEPISDAGDTGRDGFWEKKAQEQPQDELDPVGGLRIVTGAGFYEPNLDTDETLADNASNIVWPDWMPVLDEPAADSYPDYLKELPDKPDEPNQRRKRPHLKMRATAVYHYRHKDGKEPIACVATYYDPTNEVTAQNRQRDFGSNNLGSFHDVSGHLADGLDPNHPTRSADSKSLNGITYPPYTQDRSTYGDEVDYNAHLVYPNGRVVNPMLARARAKSYTNLSPAEQAALDSTLCAINIRNGDIAPNSTPTANFTLLHGTIQEIAFLNGKEVKAVDGNYDTATGATTYTLNSRYTLPIEERYPLEIRATVIDLNNLRTNTAGTGSPQEYMLPNSGIIYATRDDALPDASDVLPQKADGFNLENFSFSALSDTDKSNPRIAATDFLLDPTRRPNGIMLIKGRKLWRDFNNYREVEKGLILASNLPVYVKPDQDGGPTDAFNPHEDASGTPQQEFDAAITAASDDADFYERGDGAADRDLNKNFACRVGDPRLPSTSCQSATADNWRPASILADSVTLLSADFRAGFRNEGDYDLRNNQIDNIADIDGGGDDILSAADIHARRLKQGFWNNNFVTNGLSSEMVGISYRDSDYSKFTANTPPLNSSYFNNGITPVQRRIHGSNAAADDATDFPEYVMEICKKLPVSECGDGDWTIIKNNGDEKPASDILGTAASQLIPIAATDQGSGTTAKRPGNQWQRYARRIAFDRDLATHALVLTNNGNPDPIVVQNNGTIQKRSLDPNNVRLTNNALWYVKTGTMPNFLPLSSTLINDPRFVDEDSYKDQQPLLDPILQLQFATNQPGVATTGTVGSVHWIPRATEDTIFNLVMATGDNPSRPVYDFTSPALSHQGDIGSALSIFPRFLENWIDNAGNAKSVEIRGSFIQLKRSQYATAPYYHLPLSQSSLTPSVTPRMGGLFNRPQQYRDGNQNKAPYYNAPDRNWGFDVGLLSQIPDLFSQQFVLPSAGQPNIFYREVSRNDPWVETLLCAAVPTGQTTTADRDGDGQLDDLDGDGTPDQFGTFTYQKALNDSERPNCPTF